MHSHFRVTEEGVEVDEGSGNTFHLGPILRKYTPAKLVIKGVKRYTTCEYTTLYDSIGLLRSLQYDVKEFNSAIPASTSKVGESPSTPLLTQSEVKYACYRLTKQASAFGVRVPRPGTGEAVVVPGLDELVALVEGKFSEELATARGMLAGGVCEFASLGEFFVPGRDLVDRGAATGVFGVPTAMRVRASYYSRGKSLFGVVSTFYAALEFVVSVGEGKYAVIEFPCPIADFTGTRSTSQGMENFVVLSEALSRELSSRGRAYLDMTSHPASAFVEYSPGSFLRAPRVGGGGAQSRGPASSTASGGGGRMMIDTLAAWQHGVHAARSEGSACEAVKGVLKLLAKRGRVAVQGGSPSAAGGGVGASSGGSGDAQLVASDEEEGLELLLLSSPLPPSLLHRTWPVVAGFSFQAKAWGVVLVGGLRGVVFNEGAFQRLVMPEPRKRLIEALVMSHRGVGGSRSTTTTTTTSSKPFSMDVMAGKGEGTIFLLHGPPGVGKTLTAEAIAEMLHRPLYVVSMGELGTTPEALEERLGDVLGLCVPWGALVLIDEAEMLLETRAKSDIVRNAMVCVMLRLLEYYSGILFLTTNRVESLDPAFQSRVQCALRYAPLDAGARACIWRDILGRVEGGVEEGVDVEALAAHELNGRQIKNCLQLAVALSNHEGVTLAQRHILATLDITLAFVREMGGS